MAGIENHAVATDVVANLQLSAHQGNVSQVLKYTKPAEWAEIKDWMDPRCFC